MKLGTFVPSYLLPGQDAGHGDRIRRFAVAAEDLGFDSLFITDHLLTASRFYRVSWTEPMMTLSHVAAVTTRVKLGTSVLVLPTRQPVVLAKEIATLQHLSGGRFVYGVGTGWYPPEFESTGSTRHERGPRTDEVLEASMQLLKGGHVTFEGKFYRMNDITVEPLSHVPPVWVAGGAQFAHAASPDQPEMSPKVLDRICRWDGWIARPTAAPPQIVEDLGLIDAELNRRGTSRAEKKFTVAHENFCWLSEKTSRDDAVDEQKRYMMGVVSDERPWDYIEAVYLTGTIDDIQRRIQERVDAGVEEVFLHTMTADVHQLELFAKHILEPFAKVRAKVAR
jgi:probable F420-dependent oxidoreductase